MYRLLTRYTAFYVLLIAAIIFSLLALRNNMGWWLVALPLIALSLWGVVDLTQTRHAIRRNYPIIGNLRFLFERFDISENIDIFFSP